PAEPARLAALPAHPRRGSRRPGRAPQADGRLPGRWQVSAAAEVVRRLTERGLTLATAESTTGGLTGHLVVSVPGASRVFVGGVAAYGRRLKLDWLHVPAETVQQHGSVSEETVLAMARGARDALGVDVAVAESGIASP